MRANKTIPLIQTPLYSIVHPESHHQRLPQGTRLARRYVLHELISYGSMAQVYRAEHETIARPVAIKVLNVEHQDNPAIALRFLQEARAATKIRHENVVEVTDYGKLNDGRPFLVMEYLEGEDLSATLQRESVLPWTRALPILVQLLAALHASHAHHFVHRDIKPENVFRISRMGSDDFIKLCDFGIAKAVKSSVQLTLDGQTMGTPAYMSPEQCRGQRVDARSDVYSAGVLAYEMLTGALPFNAKTPVKMFFHHLRDPVPPMTNLGGNVMVDERVEAVIRRALAKHPDERFSSAKEFADALLVNAAQQEQRTISVLRSLFRRLA